MKMWIARSQDNELSVFKEKPFLLEMPEPIRSIWVYEDSCGKCASWRYIGERIDSNDFPEVTFENSPVEVEIVIKK